MALEFSDFDLPPEERVKMREKAFESFANIAQPAYQEQIARERGQVAQDVYQQAAGATAAGQPSQIGGILGQAAEQTAKLLPSQARKSDELAMQGAQMKEDIISSRQLAGIDRYAQQTEDMKISTARKLANQAFQMGMDAKQLALAQNSYLADEGLRRMYDDLQAGRITQQEVMALQSKMQLEAEEASNALKQEEARLRGEIDVLLASRNVEAARARYKELERLQKAALSASAKAASTGQIISGIFKVGATVVGGIYGGAPGSIAAGAAADTVTEAVQK